MLPPRTTTDHLIVSCTADNTVVLIDRYVTVATIAAKMFSRFAKPVTAIATRSFSTTKAANKSVAVMGASGGEWRILY